MIKKKVFQDIPRYEINEDEVQFAQHEGRVIVRDPFTKTVVLEKWNKVILPGSFYTLQKHFPGIKLPVQLPNYNKELDLDNTVALTPEEKLNEIVVLFAMGTDGCGPEGSQIYDVDYTKWIDKDHLIPFRYCISDNDLNDELRGKYFGRKELKELDRVAYFFKAFDADPICKSIYMDGTPVDENVYTSLRIERNGEEIYNRNLGNRCIFEENFNRTIDNFLWWIDKDSPDAYDIDNAVIKNLCEANSIFNHLIRNRKRKEQTEANEKARVEAIREEEQRQIDLIKQYCEKKNLLFKQYYENVYLIKLHNKDVRQMIENADNKQFEGLRDFMSKHPDNKDAVIVMDGNIEDIVRQIA